MWESYGKSSFPHVGILWEIVIPICGNPMGIPTEILWEWDGNGNENSLPTATLTVIHRLIFAWYSYVNSSFRILIEITCIINSPLKAIKLNNRFT